jgi:hypothetical protein
MAQKTVIVSDLSGATLAPEQAATVVINLNGERYTLDVARDEIEHMIQRARKTTVRSHHKKKKVEVTNEEGTPTPTGY